MLESISILYADFHDEANSLLYLKKCEALSFFQTFGHGPISPSIAYKILQMVQHPTKSLEKQHDDENFFQLSEKEKEILQLLSQGLEYKEIGLKMSISPNTVKKHCINIYQKLHVNSKAQALRIAYTRGLIDN